MPGESAELRAVDERLRMLYPHADGEGLCGDLHAPVEQHPVRVARGLTQRQHRRAAGDPLPAVHYDRLQTAVLRLYIGELRAEADLAARGLDGFPYVGNHHAQHVRADVGLRVDGYALRRAVLDERFSHDIRARVLYPRRELAVGERSGAALAEHDIAVRVELAALPEHIDVRPALLYALAAVDQYDLVAAFRERERREEPRRARADHDHGIGLRHVADDGSDLRLFGRLYNGLRESAAVLPVVGVVDLERCGVDEPYVVLVPRVERPFYEADIVNPLGGEPRIGADQQPERRLVRVEGHI